ncbi:MAG: peptide chain release factor N(5)-glutamine methyltransferase [Candidatus Omnitrophica bacterium]|nr:peptide chain release factor N(5)-glutamine methyltransferase [Candidatus Omnitrophota bacterium]
MSEIDPQTLGEWLKWATRKLRAKQVESPDLSANLILSEVTDFTRSKLIGFAEEPLSADHQDRAYCLLQRRLRHEPMAYILGRKDFRNLTLKVSPAVLIPRPETEELIDLAREIQPRASHIIDVGTGSGCIPLSLAEVFPESHLFGVDFSIEALHVALSNDPASRVNWIRADWLGAFASGSFDLAVSNPPYLTEQEMETLEPQVRDYEPVSALDGGVDGCDQYRRLIPQIARCLRSGGHTVLEIGPSVAHKVAGLLNESGFRQISIHKDLAGRDRFASGVV